MTAVEGDRRYRGSRRCPICDGADQDPRGAEKRCFGFLSEDGLFAHCSREERAGGIAKSSASETYGHRLIGPCRCGQQHTAPVELARPTRREVASYDYRDEDGVLLYQVVRYEPKAFAQRLPPVVPGGKWIWKLGEVRRVLYRLDRVLEAEPETTIWIVEGEKDVHAMESIGLVATCNPQGAGKWAAVTKCAEKALAGRPCVVVADADEKGRKHALQVKSALAGVASSVRVLEFPGGKDSAEWIEAGGTASALEVLLAQPVPEPGAVRDVNADFARADDGKILHTQGNIRLAFAKLGAVLRYDEFADRETIDWAGVTGVDFDDAMLNRLRLRIDEDYNFRVAKELFRDVTANECRIRSYHPVRGYLGGLRWDGVGRLGGVQVGPGWLTTYGGALDTDYVRAVGRLSLVAAVRRVRQPGCKFDEMLILEGRQGVNKSSALAVLGGAWFGNAFPLDGDTQKLMEATAGCWIIEAPELKGMRRGDVNALKAQLAQQFDECRQAYAHKKVKRLRQFVAIGTTNETSDYLKDDENRRFWPVSVTGFDISMLLRDRDQLWAEAAAAEATGESIRLESGLWGVAALEQDARRSEDPMALMVDAAFGDLMGRVLVTDAWRLLGITNRPLTQDEMTRFGSAMKSHGWIRKQLRDLKGNRPYFYVRGSDSETYVTISCEGVGNAFFASIKSS